MLFSENFEYIMNENENMPEILNPKEGLILGNMFLNMYLPYKNYKPSELVATSNQESCLLKIQELSLAVNDLGLYLDLNPNDQEVYSLFKKYAKQLNECVENYSKNYEVLELNMDINNNYSWYKSPWPWEGENHV